MNLTAMGLACDVAISDGRCVENNQDHTRGLQDSLNDSVPQSFQYAVRDRLLSASTGVALHPSHHMPGDARIKG